MAHNKHDEVLFRVIHLIEKTAPLLGIVKECIDSTSKVNPAREALKQAIITLDKALELGLEHIKEHEKDCDTFFDNTTKL